MDLAGWVNGRIQGEDGNVHMDASVSVRSSLF